MFCSQEARALRAERRRHARRHRGWNRSNPGLNERGHGRAGAGDVVGMPRRRGRARGGHRRDLASVPNTKDCNARPIDLPAVAKRRRRRRSPHGHRGDRPRASRGDTGGRVRDAWRGRRRRRWGHARRVPLRSRRGSPRGRRARTRAGDQTPDQVEVLRRALPQHAPRRRGRGRRRGRKVGTRGRGRRAVPGDTRDVLLRPPVVRRRARSRRRRRRRRRARTRGSCPP